MNTPFPQTTFPINRAQGPCRSLQAWISRNVQDDLRTSRHRKKLRSLQTVVPNTANLEEPCWPNGTEHQKDTCSCSKRTTRGRNKNSKVHSPVMSGRCWAPTNLFPNLVNHRRKSRFSPFCLSCVSEDPNNQRSS